MLVYVRIDDFVFFSDILLINAASGRGKEYKPIPYELSPCVEIYLRQDKSICSVFLIFTMTDEIKSAEQKHYLSPTCKLIVDQSRTYTTSIVVSIGPSDIKLSH